MTGPPVTAESIRDAIKFCGILAMKNGMVFGMAFPEILTEAYAAKGRRREVVPRDSPPSIFG